MSDDVVAFIIVMIFMALIWFCICALKNPNRSPAVYSAPIVVTSRTHQPPGSSQRITLIDESPSSSGFTRRSSCPATIRSMPFPKPGFTIPGSQINSSAPYLLINAGSPYPPQSSYPHSQEAPYPPQTSFPQHMPLPSHMPYPPSTMYPPQDVSNVTQRSNTPQPTAPYPTNPASEDMDVPPNYDEAVTNFSKEQKNCN